MTSNALLLLVADNGQVRHLQLNQFSRQHRNGKGKDLKLPAGAKRLVRCFRINVELKQEVLMIREDGSLHLWNAQDTDTPWHHPSPEQVSPPIAVLDQKGPVLLASSDGKIKVVELAGVGSELSTPLTLPGPRLAAAVPLTDHKADVYCLFSSSGRFLTSSLDQLSVRSHGAQGIKGMRLAEDEQLIGAAADSSKEIDSWRYGSGCPVLGVTRRGRALLTQKGRVTTRGAVGPQLIRMGMEKDQLAAGFVVSESGDIVIVSSRGRLIRFSRLEIRESHRGGVGVCTIQLGADDWVLTAFPASAHE